MPRGGILAHFIGPGVGVFSSFFARGWGIHPSKKLTGGWSGLELTDTKHFPWESVFLE